jgi:predicted flap endonuclease-1-like 5' DNA nuclease
MLGQAPPSTTCPTHGSDGSLADIEMDGSGRGPFRGVEDIDRARTMPVLTVAKATLALDQVLPPEKRKRPKIGLQNVEMDGSRRSVGSDDALDFLSGILERDAVPAPRRPSCVAAAPVLRSNDGGPVALGKAQLDGARVHAAAAAAETTPLDRATLQGLGPKKVARLATIGICTVEQLAKVDVDDRALVEAATHNRRFDRAVATLSKWRREAATFLRRKASGEVVPRKGRGTKRRAAAPPDTAPVAAKVSSDSTGLGE